MSKPFNTITVTLFVVVNLAALSLVTYVWSEPWVSSAYGAASNAEQASSLVSAAPEAVGSTADADTSSPYPYPVPVRTTRSGSDLFLIAQLMDLLLTLSLTADDDSQGMEVYLYQLDNLNSNDQARIIGSAFKTEIFDQNGQRVTELDEPVELVFTYDDGGMTDADEEALQLYQWDASTQTWLPIESTVDIENNTITANLHVNGATVTAAGGQITRRSNDGSLELALMGRSRLYLPIID